MPRLLINRKKLNPIPPCGRRVIYQFPTSPFQVLIENARIKRKLSYREIAQEIGKSAGVVWQWLHSKNGTPTAGSCKEQHLERLAACLDIPLPQIKEAYDLSRHRFTEPGAVVPRPSTEAFQQFIEAVEHDKRTVLKKTYVLNLAKRLLKSGQ